MFKKLFALLSDFFSSLFGSRETPPVPDHPAVNYDTPAGLIEDSSDMPQDTVAKVKIVVIKPLPVVGPFADPDKEATFEGSGSAPAGGTTSGGAGTTPPTPTPATPTTPPPVTPTASTPAPQPIPKHVPRYLWCLDNGHGKLQPGKRSPQFDDGVTRFFEYEFNRDVVVRIMKAMDEKGVKYYDLVPDYLTVGSFLVERVERANKKVSDLSKIYVSVHSNAGPAAPEEWVASNIKGIETWYAQGSTKGKKIATAFQQQLIAHTGWKNRNLKSTNDSPLYVLLKTVMPAILTENGFYNNKEEVKELSKPEIRQKIADAHVAAIMAIEKDGIG